ncbi:MAG TPA: DUF933 domain-containing protein [bacterium]|nr:DUF933 domain-containing protein [bacterium]HPP12131.1 DUF933 domain-containing protein [bacterium]
MIRVALFGYSGAGKTTLFQALTGKKEEVYDPFTPNLGIARLPDSRLSRIAEILKSRKTVFPEIEFLDWKGFPEGQGFPPEFFKNFSEVELLVLVVDNFSGNADPEEQAASLSLELVFSDQEKLSKILERRQAEAAAGKVLPADQALLLRCQQLLEKETPLSSLPQEERRLLSGLEFISLKPRLVFVNGQTRPVKLAEPFFQAEANSLNQEEFFLALKERLGLIEFYTVKGETAQGWLVPAGLEAKAAAGKIHRDMETGFIKAAVLPYKDLLEIGSWQKAKNLGVLKFLGPHSIFSDGDVVEIYFHQ